MMGQKVLHSSEDVGWRTPASLFELLEKVAEFGLDLAASRETSLMDGLFLGPGSSLAEDALNVSWREFGKCGFLNPPYQRGSGNPSYDIARWAKKAWEEGAHHGFETWGLFPYATQTAWWRRYVEGHAPGGWAGYAASEVWRFPRRVAFLPSEATAARMEAAFKAGARTSAKAGGAGHNVAVVIWRRNPGFVGIWQPAVRYWDFR